MAVSFVKKLGTVSGATGSAQNITIPAGGVALGDLIVFSIASNGTFTSLVDSKSNPYALGRQSTAQRGVFMYYTRAVTALVSGDTISVTFAAGAFLCAAAAQWTNIDPNSLDTVAASNSAAVTSLPVGPARPTTYEDSLAVAAFAVVGGTADVTPDAAYTELDDFNNSGNDVHLEWEYRILTTHDAPSATASVAVASSYDAVLCTFKGLTPPATPYTQLGGTQLPDDPNWQAT